MKNQERKQQQEKMFSFIEQWQQGNLPQHTFCKEQGLSYTTFYYWLKRYRLRQGEAGGFMAMKVTSSRENFIEVRYPSGVVLHIPSTISLSAIKQLISI
jgi:hypothetical protein